MKKKAWLIEFLSKSLLNSYFDIVIVQNIISDELYRKIRKQSRIVIYDINDNLLCPHHSMCELTKYISKTADYLVCCSNYLLRGYKRFNSNCICIPDAVEPAINNLCAKKHHTSEEVVIVWHGYRDNLIYFSEICDSLEAMNKKYKLKVKIIIPEYDYQGRSNREKVQSFNFKSEFVKWELVTFLQEVLEGDIGIAPLFVNDDFCLAKSTNKILSYMSLGIPAIASAIPSYKEIIMDGHNGYLAQTANDWYAKLERLIVNAELRKEMGTRGIKVCDNFSIDAIGEKWGRLLKDLKSN